MQAPRQQQQQQQQQIKKRLKDSCTNCAASKVKCSKVKPSCGRCEDRGITCHYTLSQRSGRRSTPSSIGTAAGLLPAITSSSEPTRFEVHTSSTPTNTAFQRRALETTLGSLSAGAPDKVNNRQFADFQMMNFDSEARPFWDAGTVSPLNLDDFTFDTTMVSPLDIIAPSTGCNSGSDSLSLNCGSSSLSGSNPTTTTSAGSFDGLDSSLSDFDCNDNIKEPASSTSDRPHSCLTLALNILPLLHIPPSTCTLVSFSPNACDLPTLDYIISTNKKVIDSISLMLDCSCSLDEQLGFILALITFKIMAWYAAAAKGVDSERRGGTYNNFILTPPSERQQQRHVSHFSTSTTTTTASSNSSITGTSSGITGSTLKPEKYHGGLDGVANSRMRAQLILSEFHRVVRLVELLSKRFEEARACADTEVALGLGDHYHDGGGGGGAGGPFKADGWISASVFVQLKADLRKRLQTVAKETMSILRNG